MGAHLNVQTPGNLEGLTGPRVCRDAYEQRSQHRKHVEKNSAVHEPMGTRSRQHILVGGDDLHAALDVDPVEGRGGGSGTRSGERGLQHGLAHAANSSLGASGKVDSLGSPAGDHEDAKTRRTLERHQSRLQPW